MLADQAKLVNKMAAAPAPTAAPAVATSPSTTSNTIPAASSTSTCCRTSARWLPPRPCAAAYSAAHAAAYDPQVPGGDATRARCNSRSATPPSSPSASWISRRCGAIRMPAPASAAVSAAFLITTPPPAKLSEFRFSPQNSRIGFRIDGNWKDAHFIGYNEFDFLGTSGSQQHRASPTAPSFRASACSGWICAKASGNSWAARAGAC